MFKRITLVAHRGYSSIAPENTLAAFSEAIDRGYKHIEFDVQLSKDNIAVVIHDSTLDRTTNGTGKVRQYNFSELKQLDAGSWFNAIYKDQTIPSLLEVLILLKGRARLHIELKKDQPELPLVVATLLKETGWLDDIEHRFLKEKLIRPRIIVSSDDRDLLLASMKLLPQTVMHEIIVEKVTDESLQWAVNNKLFSYHPEAGNVTPELLKKAKNMNINIGAWWWNVAEQDIRRIKGAHYAFVDAPDQHRPLARMVRPLRKYTFKS